MNAGLPVRFAGIIFDFDGVLIESEYLGNKHIADYLTRIGHPTSTEESMANFMGLSGEHFINAIEGWIGGPLPDDFHAERENVDRQAFEQGIGAVAGAVAFVAALPPELPIAIASSSNTQWIRRHLDHIGLADRFGDRVFSGREHVSNGKPAPDIYHHAAAALDLAIADCAILEDSPVGATGAVASGAFVIGLVAGSHCPPDHDQVLIARGVDAIARDFQDVARLIA